jgi:ornithine cyclodeaminase
LNPSNALVSDESALPPHFSVVSGSTVARVIGNDLAGCIDVIRRAYLTHARGDTVNPNSIFLRFPHRANARIIGLAAHVSGTPAISGMKWIASYPDNIHSGLPRASAVLILNRDDNGYPFACLEASTISAARTAASATLAAEYLVPTPRRVRGLAIIGAGLIARHVYQFLIGTGWTIEAVHVHDKNPSEAERFISQVCDAKRHRSVTATVDLASAVQSSDLVVFATVTQKPHVYDRDVFAHHPVVLHLSLRDLAPELLLDSCNIVDDIEHVMHADTSPHLVEQRTGSRAFVAGTLADVVEARCSVPRDRTVIFSPFGLGVLDVALGQWVYDQAKTSGDCITIEDFFGRLER